MPFANKAVITLSNRKATKLGNVNCVYCGEKDMVEKPLTDEHVIGRRFVPKGSLARGWTLIVRSCERCNNQKSDLEDDISAITLLPDPGGSHSDPDLTSLALRK